MTQRSWTFREGVITDKDKAAIRGICTLMRPAAKIFLTGEIGFQHMYDLDIPALVRVNDTLQEPLFVATQYHTLRMTRFEARVVWSCLPYELFEELLELAIDGYNAKPFTPPKFDFYHSLFIRLGLMGTFIPSQANPNVTPFIRNYLNALTLFQKPLYADVHATEFLTVHCHDWGALTGRHKLSKALLVERDQVWNTESARLTNAELEFLGKL